MKSNYGEYIRERFQSIKYPPIRIRGKHKFGHLIHIANARSGHNFVRNNIFSWTDEGGMHTRRHYNLENFPPEFYIGSTQECDFNKYPHSIFVIQTRDLLNWFASYCSFLSVNGNSKFKEYHLELWLRIAKEFYGETNYLPQKFIRILYDDFFRSEEYRRNICEQIPFAIYNEEKLNYVGIAGRGSTFDKRDYDGNAQEMKVLERYKQVPKEHRHWWKVLKEHPDIIEFYLKHFDVSDDKKRFIDSIK